MEEATFYIDASYFIFYRFYALMQWWNVAKKDEPLTNPIENEEFVEKFKTTFINKIKEIPKKCGVNPKKTKVNIYAARDCPREDIWRREIFKDYKANRNYEGFQGGPFFAMAYKEDLFGKAGVIETFRHPRLEADDCIAIRVKKQLSENPEAQIYIITSDHDYLQMVAENVHIINLFIKIVMGDNSDNIPSIFPKCGFITAKKCYENPEFYEKKRNSESEKIFERNNKIINFDFIPENFKREFLE
jgi:5'-3' exonuclease